MVATFNHLYSDFVLLCHWPTAPLLLSALLMTCSASFSTGLLCNFASNSEFKDINDRTVVWKTCMLLPFSSC